MDHLPIIQFDYAYVSSGDARGQQVKMRTILDTSTGYGYSVCDRRERCWRQVCNFFCCVVLERTGVHTVSLAEQILNQPIKSHVDTVIKCLANDRNR